MSKRFVNLDGSGPQPFSSVLKWGIVDRLAGRRRRSPARAPVPRVEADPRVLASPPPRGRAARLTWLGHASFLVQLDGVNLLTDAVLFERITGGIRRNVPPALGVNELPPIAASLVSHNHYDHLDLPTLAAVGAPVIGGIGIGRYLTRIGLECTELDWWQRVDVAGVQVSFVPSQHWSRRGLSDVNQSLWGGFVIEGHAARVYHAGDTAYFEGFREIGRRFPDIDAAMLPIGAYDPAWFMEQQHMNPEQATQGFVDLGARRFVAMHWGTFKLTDEPLDEPPERLRAEWKRRGLDEARLGVPAVGESLHAGRAGGP